MNLDKLMDEASQGAKSVGCRFGLLKGDPKVFMEAINLAYSQGIRKVSQVRIREILRREFEVDVSVSLISNHLRETCSCVKKNSKN